MIAQFILLIFVAFLVWRTIVETGAFLPKRNEALEAVELSKRSTKRVREATLNELYFRCKDLADQGEVTYFSVDDIWNITEELKYKK